MNFTFDPVTRDTTGFIPVEWWEDVFQAIWYAVAHGVLVVEAAGNGSVNLDDPVYDTPGPGFPAAVAQPFGRTSVTRTRSSLVPEHRPAGHDVDRSRLAFSNYGSMVDAQGWGSRRDDDRLRRPAGRPQRGRWYTGIFAGTSSATPIVAGALACVQGVRSAHVFGERLTPITARQLLRDTGTPQTTRRIGRLASGSEPAEHRSVDPRPCHLRAGPRRVHGRGAAHRRPPAVVPPSRPSRRHGSLGRGSADAHHGLGPLIAVLGSCGRGLRDHSTGTCSGDGISGPATAATPGRRPSRSATAGTSHTSSAPVRARSTQCAVRPRSRHRPPARRRPADVRALGWSDGTPRWNGEPQLVGSKWLFDHIFAGDDGVIYAVTRDGDLWRYFHEGRGDAEPTGGARATDRPRLELRTRLLRRRQMTLRHRLRGRPVVGPRRRLEGARKRPPHRRVGHGWHFRPVFAG